MMRPRILATFGVGPVGAVGVALVAALMFSAVHYVLIDRQVLRLRARWYTEARGRRAWAIGFTLVALGLLVGGYFHIQNSRSGVVGQRVTNPNRVDD